VIKEPTRLLTSPGVTTAVVISYLVLMFLLLLAELGVPGLGWLRATNQVLILLALVFLPFLFIAASQAVRSISLKISGQELHLELVELRDTVDKDIKGVETRIANQVSTAEQALWPMLAGDDPTREQRWNERTIIIGSKLDPSQAFFAQFLAVWLERKVPGLRCMARVPNGGSLKNFADLKHGWIDVYIEYTGTASQYFNIEHRGRTPQDIHKDLNEYGARIGIRFGKRVGASENYALVVNTRLAEAEGLRTIRDLARVAGRLVFTADPEFLNRRDCYIGLKNNYDLDFRRIEPCRITQRFELMESGQADVFVGYETDPELQSPALRVLMDSEGFFPDYHAVPAVSMRAAERISGLDEALDQLGEIMTTPDLVTIVHKLRHRGLHPAVVREIADQFLREKAAVV
jgi:glycine betaine/choline ABC-type transport system substrate-binding protein